METEEIKTRLIAEIRAAFSTETPAQPNKDNISRVCSDDEGTADYFAGQTWEGHSAKKLRELDFALNIFTPQAFAYYFPAFMIADIEEPEVLDFVGESILYSLIPQTYPGRAEAIRELLSENQRKAVVHYYEYAHLRDGYGINDELYDDVIKRFS